MMALGFTVIFVVGVLRPIRDAIALDGLEPGDFYQVYFVSAIVVLFAPVFNRLADRVPWRRLIPGVALFFAASMVVFRIAYQPGVPAFGLAFYGWYDLMVAALVTQFFMATQVFYNARDAKRAYPLVIAAGSLGAAVGGGITAFFATRLGTPNLLLVAAAAIVVFAVGIAMVWAREAPEQERSRDQIDDDPGSKGELRRIFSNPQVRLIAVTVLLTVLVKQFIDYEYKTLTREVFTDLDALSGFLGLVDAATQWLPIIVLLALRPVLRRWGAGAAVLIFPIAMVLATGAMAASLTLAVAVIARTSEKTFRYSAERTGREILYVPVPEDIKLKAKAYVDVGVEKGLGKVLSGVLLAIPAVAMGSFAVRDRLVVVALVGVGLAGLLLIAFLRVRGQYVTSLARSFEGRTASFGSTFVSLSESGALGFARDALKGGEPLKVAFTLDLLDDASVDDLDQLAPELHQLAHHDAPEIRREALNALARLPAKVDEPEVRKRLDDADRAVREAAVRTLASASPEPLDFFEDLLESERPAVRSAALAGLRTVVAPADAERLARPHFDRLSGTMKKGPDAAVAIELATTAGLVGGHPDKTEILRSLMADSDPIAASAAVLSAGRTGDPGFLPDLIGALGTSKTRSAARAALAERGEEAVGPLIACLNDPTTDGWIRKGVAAALGDIAVPATVHALIASYLLPETEQALDDQALLSLHHLRASGVDLEFPESRVLEVVDREVAAMDRYGRAAGAARRGPETRSRPLLVRALDDARESRRLSAFRWMGLIHPQYGMQRSQLVLKHGGDRQKANALEWIESTVGHSVFQRLSRLLEPTAGPEPEPVAAEGEGLRPLWDDEDVWIARCALWSSFEADPDGFGAQLTEFAPHDPALGETAARLAAHATSGGSGALGSRNESEEMDLIEKVFLLQNVDLLAGVRSQQLALFASIAKVQHVEADHVLIAKGEPTPAMYVVIQGTVAMGGLDQTMTVTAGQAFGTWALIDDQPSLVEARAVEDTRVLRVLQVDFRDLLVDHPELGLDLLQGLARRVRGLATA